MKKIFFSALAALSLAACVQEATVDVPQNDAIAFENAFIDNATRAAFDPSFDINTLNAFKVWAYVNEPNGVVFKGTKVSRTGVGAPWTYEGTQYWAPGQKYYFEAIAPAEGNWELPPTNDADPTVLSFTNANGTEDLLYASTQQTGAAIGTVNESVKFSFGHMLSKVKFTFNNGFLTDNVTVKVTDIKMVAPKKAEIDLREEADMAWVNASETVELAFGDVADLNLAVKSNECAAERFTIPGDYEYTITFNLELYMGAQRVYKELKTSTVRGVKLEMGKAYNFVAEISPATLDFEAIEFEVEEVEEWITSGDPSYDNQAAEAELQAAAQLGGTYKLTKDVVIDAPVVVPAGVNFVLDLNGNNITSSGDVFEVAGGNLTINGEGTVYAATNNDAPYCAVWAYGDGYVRINGGEYKIGYPAGDYNDLIYAKDNAKIDIYGGYFHNSGSENAFVLNIKDGSNAKITVYGGSFDKFNPADNLSENPKQSFVAEGYISIVDGEKYTVTPGVFTGNKEAFLTAIATPGVEAVLIGDNFDFGSNETVIFENSVDVYANGKTISAGAGNKGSNAALVPSIAVMGDYDVTLNNIDIEGGFVGSYYGADIIVDGVNFTYQEGASGRNAFYAVSNTSNTSIIRIKDIDLNMANASGNSYLTAHGNAIIYVEGGNFYGKGARSSNAPIKVVPAWGYTPQVIISGGTFDFDPSKEYIGSNSNTYPAQATIAEGYKVVKNGSYWTVVAE